MFFFAMRFLRRLAYWYYGHAACYVLPDLMQLGSTYNKRIPDILRTDKYDVRLRQECFFHTALTVGICTHRAEEQKILFAPILRFYNQTLCACFPLKCLKGICLHTHLGRMQNSFPHLRHSFQIQVLQFAIIGSLQQKSPRRKA